MFGNVGDYGFTDNDHLVIERHAWEYYESERIISGLPFQKPLPRLAKSVHHDGIRETNEEIMRHRVDEELYNRWTSARVALIKFVRRVVVSLTNYLYR